MNITKNLAETDEAQGGLIHGLGAAGPGSLLTQAPTAGTAILSTAATADANDLIGAVGASTIVGHFKQALQQLLHVLRSPQSPEQQQKVLAILKSNPRLMAAFIKERQARAAAAHSGTTGVEGDCPLQLQHMLNQQQQQQQGDMQQMQAMIGDLCLEDLDPDLVNP